MKTLKHLFSLLIVALLFNSTAFAQLSAGGGIAGSVKLDQAIQQCTTAANSTKGFDSKVGMLHSCLASTTKGSIDIQYFEGLASGMVISGFKNAAKGMMISGMRVLASVKGLAATEVEWTYKGGNIDATEVEWTYDGGADRLKLNRIRK